MGALFQNYNSFWNLKKFVTFWPSRNDLLPENPSPKQSLTMILWPGVHNANINLFWNFWSLEIRVEKVYQKYIKGTAVPYDQTCTKCVQCIDNKQISTLAYFECMNNVEVFLQNFFCLLFFAGYCSSIKLRFIHVVYFFVECHLRVHVLKGL